MNTQNAFVTNDFQIDPLKLMLIVDVSGPAIVQFRVTVLAIDSINEASMVLKMSAMR